MAFIQTEEDIDMIYDVKNVSFHYPSNDRVILDDVSLSVDNGDVLSILGPNGSGKTTLLNCMADLLKPTSGEVILNGKNINSMKNREIAKIVSYVPQVHVPTFSYSVLNFVLMGRASNVDMFSKPKKEDVEMAEKALVDLRIEHLKDKPYTEISGGERQQATIARAIVSNPSIILFDEPTAHLDYGNQLRTLRIIKTMADKGFAVIITTHNPDHAIMLSGNAAILSKNGKLLCGKSEDIITEDNLQSIYNTDLKLKYIEDIDRKICLTPNL